MRPQLRVARAEPERRTWRRLVTARERQAAHLEGLGLAAALLVVFLAGWLAYRQHAPVFDSAAIGTASGTVANINSVSGAEALAPVLAGFDTAAERELAARAIAQLRNERGALTHVGALAAIRVSAADIRRDPRLTTLRARLDGSPGAERVPLFSQGDIAFIKPSAVVRSPGQHVSRALRSALLFVLAFLFAHLVRRA
ncbi:MAG: hypothetical protein M3R55_03405, partial [Acidobacteriota bacterium]|nr:hypothetical protein [Acidobacteriota bacterium]